MEYRTEIYLLKQNIRVCMDMPKVSIIIPAYNSEKYIAKTIQSVIMQTEEDWELIAVDDGSTDGTPEILRRYAKEDCRIKVYIQPNSGMPSCARNTGLRYATGDYIAFLDSDDLYHPERISRAMEVFSKHPEVDISFCMVKSFNVCPEEENDLYVIGGESFLAVAQDYMTFVGDNTFISNGKIYICLSIDNCGVCTTGITFRRELLDSENIWFPENRKIGEDLDLWFRLVKGKRLVYIREVLAYYRQTPGSVSRDSDKFGWDMAHVHEENLTRGMDVFSKGDIQRYKKRISLIYLYTGYRCHRRGERIGAWRAYAHAFRMSPSMNIVPAYIKSFIPKRLIDAHHNRKGICTT